MEGCSYCQGTGPEPGWIWMDNNGPIVRCPICNDLDGYALAEEQRALVQRLTKQAT
ncbi:hypothetical protein LCGC14_1346850 [marine sediment metagenome]|uniref:Uncharacterized protein n=1 Tax=marine sediment metagenome TaxID=412755 RepID=A0A0F9KY56_9ZZZZ